MLTLAANQPSLAVSSAVREHGTPDLTPAAPKQLAIGSSETGALVDELQNILRSIPTESPPGSEDIYGLDTSLFWGSDDLEWYNGGPQGCGGGESSVKASDEDKKKFKRAVEIVNKLVQEAN